MTYNMASDVDTRRIVWVFQQTQTTHSCVEVAAINRRASKCLTSKRP